MTAPFHLKELIKQAGENPLNTSNDKFNPNAISNSPIIRVITLMPVWRKPVPATVPCGTIPSNIKRTNNSHKETKQIANAVITRTPDVVELIAPGPAINGNANGTTPCFHVPRFLIFLACSVYPRQAAADHRHRYCHHQDATGDTE